MEGHMQQDTLVLYDISEEEVEKRDFSGILNTLRRMENQHPNPARKLILSFSDFEDSHKEIWEFPQVRSYVEVLILQLFPGIFYYLSEEFFSRTTMLNLIADVHIGENRIVSSREYIQQDGKADMQLSIQVSLPIHKALQLVEGTLAYAKTHENEDEAQHIVKWIQSYPSSA